MIRVIWHGFCTGVVPYLMGGTVIGVFALILSYIVRNNERRYIRDHLTDIQRQDFDRLNWEVARLTEERDSLIEQVKIRDKQLARVSQVAGEK